MSRVKRARLEEFNLRKAETNLKIDKDNLDIELVHHPSMVFRVGQKVAEAISERDAYKLELKQRIGQIAMKIRPTLEKPTGKAVDEAVFASDEYEELQSDLKELESNVRLWEAMQDAWRSRGFALHNLVLLQQTEQDAIRGQAERGGRREYP